MWFKRGKAIACSSFCWKPESIKRNPGDFVLIHKLWDVNNFTIFQSSQKYARGFVGNFCISNRLESAIFYERVNGAI